MPSPARLAGGLFYHIYNRGNNRENIFLEQRNYEYFLRLYERYISPVADTYAYCLLRNHFHLLVRIKTEEEIINSYTLPGKPAWRGVFNPSQHFGNLFNAYSKSINNMYGRSGSLFQNPFGRVQITSDSHLLHLVVYIHRNPQKHGFVRDFSDWYHSSYPIIKSNKNTFLKVEPVVSWFYGKENFIAHHDDLNLTKDIEYLVSDDKM
jgi:REP element-mobilizing transposase RayT